MPRKTLLQKRQEILHDPRYMEIGRKIKMYLVDVPASDRALVVSELLGELSLRYSEMNLADSVKSARVKRILMDI